MNVGIVYLWSCVDVSDCYIGSTNSLSQRSALHRFNYNRGSTTKLYECMRSNGGIGKWKCDVLERIEGEYTRKQLLEREQYHIDKCQLPLLNTNRAVQDPEQVKQYRKEFYRDYYQRNKEAYKLRYENRKSQTIVNG